MTRKHFLLGICLVLSVVFCFLLDISGVMSQEIPTVEITPVPTRYLTPTFDPQFVSSGKQPTLRGKVNNLITSIEGLESGNGAFCLERLYSNLLKNQFDESISTEKPIDEFFLLRKHDVPCDVFTNTFKSYRSDKPDEFKEFYCSSGEDGWYQVEILLYCLDGASGSNGKFEDKEKVIYKWVELIHQTNPDEQLPPLLLSFNPDVSAPTQESPIFLTSVAATETQIAQTAAATETQIAQTAAATETQIAETQTATAATATEEARLAAVKRERVETQIAAAATATEQARLEKVKKKDQMRTIAISISLGVIGLGAAVFLFIFTQRKRKAAYQMRFEQRRINAVPALHLFDVEPKARPASTMPSGVSAGGEGNFDRSITIEPAEELSDSATMEIDMGSSSVLRYDFGNIQHQGSREYQEDSFGFSDVADPNLVASRGILAVLADGMGGLKNGKSISERTVAKFRKAFMSFTPGVEVPRQLYSLVHETNAEIYQTDKQKGGTTLICVYIYGNSMYWVSVGDSAIYLFRQGRMYQLNREHNRLNDLYLRFMYREITKAQLLAEPTLQGLTSNIGRKELRDVDQNLRELRLRRGDRILLCSDGVSGRLTEKEMLVAMSQGNAQKCTDALKNFVLKKKAPKQDNLTAQVISCD